MEGDFIKINEWLLPLSWLYGLGVRFRNALFEMGVLKQHSYSLPVISVGNITVGGAGKTPHVEYLIRLLSGLTKVAVLSRGYKRKSKGYVLANEHTPMEDIGDEPFQMKEKFHNIYVAVDKKRTEGIDRLTHDEQTKDVDVILLDDAFQHRYVKPGINILLVDYHRLIIYDRLIPAGRLREPLEGKSRADVVIITKCPPDLKPMEIRVLTKAMNLYPYQDLYFTTLEYEPLKPYNDLSDQNEARKMTLEDIHGYNVLLLTGIASPKQILTDLKPYGLKITPMTYGDHHNFKPRDIEDINQKFSAMQSPKIIITTEKDASRLQAVQGLSDEVKANLFALPIHIKFMLEQEEQFNQKIISYVRKNSRNSILVKKKDDHVTPDSHHSGNRTRTISFRNN
jgi:tetraacyldisaccharide 4'-kinase